MAGAGLYEVGPGKTYPTIQGALDQLWADQGSTEFTASQYIRIFAGTYDENVIPNASLNPDEDEGFILVIEGDPADDRENIIIAPSAGLRSVFVNCDHALIRHLKIAGTPTTSMLATSTGCLLLDVDDCVITGAKSVWIQYALRMVDSTVAVSANVIGIYTAYSGGSTLLRRCVITGLGASASTLHGIYSRTNYALHLEGCVISGFENAMTPGAVGNRGHVHVANCTVYDCTHGLAVGVWEANRRATVLNTIFKDVDYPYRVTAWPEETSTKLGPVFVQRNNCYHTYTAMGYDGVTPKTYAQWVAFGQVDSSGELDATDPKLTDPASGDFTLQDSSPCIGAGIGAGVVKDAGGDAFDPYHPSIGAVRYRAPHANLAAALSMEAAG